MNFSPADNYRLCSRVVLNEGRRRLGPRYRHELKLCVDWQLLHAGRRGQTTGRARRCNDVTWRRLLSAGALTLGADDWRRPELFLERNATPFIKQSMKVPQAPAVTVDSNQLIGRPLICISPVEFARNRQRRNWRQNRKSAAV